MDTNEQLWLEQARRGDKNGFGRLVQAYQKPVYNLAYRMLGNADEAEEAAQEAFVRAYTRLTSYDPAHKFSTWLLSITSNYCVDLLRKRRAVMLSIDEPLPVHPALMSDRESSPERQTIIHEEQIMVQALLNELPDEYRQAVVLHYWHEYSYEEIAELMQTSVSAVKSRLFRARRMMAQSAVDSGLLLQAVPT